jgi:hypothetical protein
MKPTDEKQVMPAWEDLPYPQRVFFLLGVDQGRGSEVDFSEALALYEEMRTAISETAPR